MIVGPLNRDILHLALPSILANITVPLVGLVDIAVAGHLSGGSGAAAFIGGIAVGTMLFDLLYWNFGFLRVGTGGMTAQAYGRGDRREMAAILLRGMGLALGIALILLLLQRPFVFLASLAVRSTPEVWQLALQYFFIRIWAAPATLSLFSLKGWFIGMQDTVSSMCTDLIVNGVNIAASILLARRIGFAGIAAGTLIAQFTGLLFALGVVAVKYGSLFRGFGPWRAALRDGQLRRFVTVNGDLFIRSVAMVVIYVGFTLISARQGDLMLSAASVMMKLLLLFSYFTDGFAYAGEALTGKFIGRNDAPMVRETVKWIFIWSLSVGMSFILLYGLGGVPLLRLLTSDETVIDACRGFLIWLLPMPLIGCITFTWDGIFVGATASKALRDSTLWAVIAFFGLWFALGKLLAPEGASAVHLLLGAYFAHLAARALCLSLRYRRDVLKQVED